MQGRHGGGLSYQSISAAVTVPGPPNFFQLALPPSSAARFYGEPNFNHWAATYYPQQRAHQLLLMKALEEHSKVIVALPTNSGKSIGFYGAAFCNPGTVLVVCVYRALEENVIACGAEKGLTGIRLDPFTQAQDGVHFYTSCVEDLVVGHLQEESSFEGLVAQFGIKSVFLDEIHVMLEHSVDFRMKFQPLLVSAGKLADSGFQVVCMTGTLTDMHCQQLKKEYGFEGAQMVLGPCADPSNICVTFKELETTVLLWREVLTLVSSCLKARRGKVLLFLPFKAELEEVKLHLERDPNFVRLGKTVVCVDGDTLPQDRVQRLNVGDVILSTSVLSHGVNLDLVHSVVVVAVADHIPGLQQMFARAGRGGKTQGYAWFLHCAQYLESIKHKLLERYPYALDLANSLKRSVATGTCFYQLLGSSIICLKASSCGQVGVKEDMYCSGCKHGTIVHRVPINNLARNIAHTDFMGKGLETFLSRERAITCVVCSLKDVDPSTQDCLSKQHQPTQQCPMSKCCPWCNLEGHDTKHCIVTSFFDDSVMCFECCRPLGGTIANTDDLELVDGKHGACCLSPKTCNFIPYTFLQAVHLFFSELSMLPIGNVNQLSSASRFLGAVFVRALKLHGAPDESGLWECLLSFPSYLTLPEVGIHWLGKSSMLPLLIYSLGEAAETGVANFYNLHFEDFKLLIESHFKGELTSSMFPFNQLKNRATLDYLQTLRPKNAQQERGHTSVTAINEHWYMNTVAHQQVSQGNAQNDAMVLGTRVHKAIHSWFDSDVEGNILDDLHPYLLAAKLAILYFAQHKGYVPQGNVASEFEFVNTFWEKDIIGRVDLLLMNQAGDLIIVDWKVPSGGRSYIPPTTLEQGVTEVNLYKYLLEGEMAREGLVKNLFLVGVTTAKDTNQMFLSPMKGSNEILEKIQSFFNE